MCAHDVPGRCLLGASVELQPLLVSLAAACRARRSTKSSASNADFTLPLPGVTPSGGAFSFLSAHGTSREHMALQLTGRKEGIMYKRKLERATGPTGVGLPAVRPSDTALDRRSRC
ncbi:Phosphoinositide 3-Kinase Regulatory Subunit 4 [Manis pentadactyla]|nr:Phosphoinositide 3-Kinase Regulatory Subunit 4 [Manis pentadactyla]